MHVKYRIISVGTIPDLEYQIKEATKNGWKLRGELQVTSHERQNSEFHVRFTQVITKLEGYDED